MKMKVSSFGCVRTRPAPCTHAAVGEVPLLPGPMMPALLSPRVIFTREMPVQMRVVPHVPSTPDPTPAPPAPP